MNEHLQELKRGGRSMTKLDLANKEIERLKEIINISIWYIQSNVVYNEKVIDDLRMFEVERLLDILNKVNKVGDDSYVRYL